MPKVFGWQHIVYIVLTLVTYAVCLFLTKKYIRTQKSRDILFRISAATLFVLIVWNRISIAVVAKKPSELIPPSFCGLTSLLLAVFTFFIKNKNHAVFHCIVYVSFLALLAVVYPDFLGQAPSIMHSRTISGLLHHSMSVLLAMLLISVGGFRPSLKKWYCLPLGLCVYLTHGLFLLQVFDSGNPMLIVKPLLPSTPLTWYNLGIMLIALKAVVVLCYEGIKRKIEGKKLTDG